MATMQGGTGSRSTEQENASKESPVELTHAEVQDIKRFAKHKAHIEARTQQLHAHAEIDAFAGFHQVTPDHFDGLHDGVQGIWSELEERLASTTLWLEEVEQISTEASSLEGGDMERMRRLAKEASEREMRPEDTDLIEIAVQTLVALDGLLRLLHSRKKAIDILRARLLWEQQRRKCWLLYAPLVHDIDDFVTQRARWSPSIYKYDNTDSPRSNSSNLSSLPVDSDQTPTRRACSPSSTLRIHCTPSGSSARQMALAIKTESSVLARRCHAFAHEHVALAGKRLDDMIELSKLPDTFLDEQDKLDDASDALQARQLFLVQLSLQWSKADELFRELRALHIDAREVNAMAKQSLYNSQRNFEDASADATSGPAIEALASRADHLFRIIIKLCGPEAAAACIRQQSHESIVGAVPPTGFTTLKMVHIPTQPESAIWPEQKSRNEALLSVLQVELDAGAKHLRHAFATLMQRAAQTERENKSVEGDGDGGEEDNKNANHAQRSLQVDSRPAQGISSHTSSPQGLPQHSASFSELAYESPAAERAARKRTTSRLPRPASKSSIASTEAQKAWPALSSSLTARNSGSEKYLSRKTSDASVASITSSDEKVTGKETHRPAIRSASSASISASESRRRVSPGPRTPRPATQGASVNNSLINTQIVPRSKSLTRSSSRNNTADLLASVRLSNQKQKRIVSDGDSSVTSLKTLTRVTLKSRLHERETDVDVKTKTSSTAKSEPSSRSVSRNNARTPKFRNFPSSSSGTSGRSGKPNAYKANPKSKLDVEVGKIVNQLDIPVEIAHVANVEMEDEAAVREQWHDVSGKYWVGYPNPRLCFCRILPSQTVMVRIGGGWEELSSFIVKHYSHLTSASKTDATMPQQLGVLSPSPSVSRLDRQTSLAGTPQRVRLLSTVSSASQVRPSSSREQATPLSVRRKRESLPASVRRPNFTPMLALDLNGGDTSTDSLHSFILRKDQGAEPTLLHHSSCDPIASSTPGSTKAKGRMSSSNSLATLLSLPSADSARLGSDLHRRPSGERTASNSEEVFETPRRRRGVGGRHTLARSTLTSTPSVKPSPSGAAVLRASNQSSPSSSMMPPASTRSLSRSDSRTSIRSMRNVSSSSLLTPRKTS